MIYILWSYLVVWIRVVLLTFGVEKFQMKSNIRELTCFGNVSGTFILPHEDNRLEIPNIFNMQILPMGVKLRSLKAFKILIFLFCCQN